jgi:hypothetical protein
MEQQAEVLKVYIWVLSGVLGFLITLLTVVGNAMAKNLGEKLTELIKSVDKLVVITTQQTEQIKTLFSNKENAEERLSDHDRRIREIELNCKGKCLKD